jgi:3-hydroxyacyl-CoA dehydrogenase
LRSGIVAALDQALADPQVLAIVLKGSTRAFSGGGGQGAAGLFEVC